MATVPIRPRAEPAPGGPLRWIRSVSRRLLAPAGARGAPSPAPGHLLTDRVEEQHANGRPGQPGTGLQEARAAVAELLMDVEWLRPGLVLHRSLDLQGDSGVRAQALCESFGECDAFCPTPDAVRAAESENRHPVRCRYLHGAVLQELPFPDETFDFVHCGTLRSDEEDGERVIAGALRVLRLHGMAVVDTAGKRPAPPATDDSPGAVRLLVHLPVFESAREPARGTHRIAVTVTNAGARVLGSPLAPLRLRARWRHSDDAPGAAEEAVLDGILLPGDSRLTTLLVTATDTSGAHLLELTLLDASPWGERRLLATTVAVGARDPAGLGATTEPALPDVDRRVCEAVARADGVMLGVRALESNADSEPWTRYFFARA